MPIELDSLNDAQREAVLCTEGPLLVLAGAGSGKTRVLTQRIAHLVEDCGVSPWQILAITFTNKAAAEMRERLGQLLQVGMRGMWVCTFHAMCVRMLREDADRLGFSSNFTIYDEDDSKRLIRTIADELEINTKFLSISHIRSKISAAKNELISAATFEEEAENEVDRKIGEVYRIYMQRLARANAMDFDDLLFNAYRLLSGHPDILEGYQERFRYISVDEYQDTNHAQYRIANLLASRYRNLMVVGDDDQSIYSWRGADIQNILDFEKDYADAIVVRLEENYRSTGHILEAANSVVAKNQRRKEKHLYTNAGDGEKIQLYQASDERDEGRWIASEIEKLHDRGTSYDDIAVFYRTNAQSRVLEDMFLRAGVPYRIFGGTRFFDRAEIRDVMAYLKLVLNPDDDVSCERVINTPRRGIGKSSLDKIRYLALQENLPLFSAAEMAIAEDELLSPKVRNALAEFCSVVSKGRTAEGELKDVVEAIIESTGLISSLEAERTQEAAGRVENIREFLSVAQEFDETHDDVEELLESIEQLRAAGVTENGEQDEPDATATADAVDTADAAGAASSPAESSAALAQEEQEDYLLPVASEKLPAFMEWLALRSDLDSLGADNHAVTMMTVHSAKGLEFLNVFVSGLEEGLFPHMGSDDAPASIEEERRLAYVAITRAREKLFLSYAATRKTWGSTQAHARSRFIKEIPEKHLEANGVGSFGYEGFGWEKRGDRHGTYGSGRGSEMYGGRVFGSQTRSSGGSTNRENQPIQKDAAREKESYEVGERISHKTFGTGTVLSVEKDVLEIRFDKTGKTKKLMKGFAPIVKLEN